MVLTTATEPHPPSSTMTSIPSSQHHPTTNTNNTKKPLTPSVLRHRHVDTLPTNTDKQQEASPFNFGYTNHGFYDCNICFDTAIYPVLTVCGHLFCWVCLSRWLDQQTLNPTCPMCKAGCPQDKIIPVYGRGREEVDPRCDASIPSRPSGQRPEPLHNPNVAGSSIFHPFRNNTPSVEPGNSIFLSHSVYSSDSILLTGGGMYV
ncbi:hypothetical protein [Absidia glauca]|uniref:RING-type E3 ubiquitin transferase n=1 Tax=Absidia glauca TaxID=4829 RepID=A0A168LLW8_ABSGL|nr:hypothetical protein [Absidia glauca]